MSARPDDDAVAQAEAEFDTMASWTADAVRALGPAYAVPAGCRGSGSPAGLRWLGEHLGLTTAESLVDVGAGVGGPAAFAKEEFSVDAVLLDPMYGACRAARSLYDSAATVSTAERLPLLEGSARHMWCLGVLCSVDDLADAVRELARVLASDGQVGILVYVRRVADLAEEPAANHFPSLAELERITAEAGLTTIALTDLSELPATPEEWQTRADEVDAWIEREHGHEAAWQTGHESEQAVGHLISSNQIYGHLRVLRHDPAFTSR